MTRKISSKIPLLSSGVCIGRMHSPSMHTRFRSHALVSPFFTPRRNLPAPVRPLPRQRNVPHASSTMKEAGATTTGIQVLAWPPSYRLAWASAFCACCSTQSSEMAGHIIHCEWPYRLQNTSNGSASVRLELSELTAVGPLDG